MSCSSEDFDPIPDDSEDEQYIAGLTTNNLVLESWLGTAELLDEEAPLSDHTQALEAELTQLADRCWVHASSKVTSRDEHIAARPSYNPLRRHSQYITKPQNAPVRKRRQSTPSQAKVCKEPMAENHQVVSASPIGTRRRRASDRLNAALVKLEASPPSEVRDQLTRLEDEAAAGKGKDIHAQIRRTSVLLDRGAGWAGARHERALAEAVHAAEPAAGRAEEESPIVDERQDLDHGI
jgi:hypothetical protein